VHRYNPDGSGHETLVSGTRNVIGLRWYPGTDTLWGAVQERDALGDDLVPDYFTAFKTGAFYGWPYAYIGPNEDPRRKGEAPELVMLFNGAEQKLEFVTQAPPLPLQAPIAFTAVVISLESGEETGLVVRERALPNRDPFTKAEIVMRDPGITSLAFKFQNEDGDWVDTWDGQDLKAIPRGIQLRLGSTVNGRAQTLPPITVTLRTTGATR